MGSLVLPTSQFRPDFDLPAFARTIAHQWFPLKMSVADPVNDAWLSDGMAVFASLLYGEKNLSPAEFDDQVGKVLVKALAYEGSMSVRQAGGTDKDSLEYHSLVENKGAYVFRMLQWVIGNEKFDTLLSRYVDQFKDKPVSASAFAKLASDVSGDDLGYFFDQWVNSSGVPQLDASYQVIRVKNGYTIIGQIKQDLDLFRMPVELVVQTDDEPEYKRVDVVGPNSEFSVNTLENRSREESSSIRGRKFSACRRIFASPCLSIVAKSPRRSCVTTMPSMPISRRSKSTGTARLRHFEWPRPVSNRAISILR